AVPGFHHGRVVFVEGAAVGVHSGLLFPGFGDHDHHGMCQRVAGHNQEFQAVVEGGGVGLAFVDDGVEFVQVAAEHAGLHGAFAGTQPVEVAFDGVDFTVVGDHAIGVCQWPGGECVGGEAL